MARILVVDDTQSNLTLLGDLLNAAGYDVDTATSGEEALERIGTRAPDLVLLDVLMPGMDGFEVCRRLRAHEATRALPVLMVTALDPAEDSVKGFAAGANDFVSKPVQRTELLARVQSFLRTKALHDEVEALNRTLEQRVSREIERRKKYERLQPFLPPAVCDLLIESGDDGWMESHRRQIGTLFCDLRGFAAFDTEVEPEETARLLKEFHELLGGLVFDFGGTIDHIEGDGMMAFLNDPIACSEPALRTVELAVAMRNALTELLTRWNDYRYELGFGIGVSFGYATIGLVRSRSRSDYMATGTSVTLASRLCAVASNGQVLVCPDTLKAVRDVVDWEFVADFDLKGFRQPVPVHNVLSCRGK